MLWIECNFIIILISYLNIHENKFHVSIWSCHNMFSFYLSFGDDKFIVASLMSSTFVVAHVSLVHLHLFTNVTCHRLLCFLNLVVFFCILSQTSHVTILPGLARVGGVLTGKVCSESKLGNLQLFHSFWCWEYFENISWEKTFLNWENWEYFWKCEDVLEIFLGKLWQVLKMSVGKNLVGKILNIFSKCQLGKT